MRAAKVQVSLRIRAVLPEPPLLAHTSSESRGTFSQKARSLAPLNGWACAVKIYHDGMLEDTKLLDMPRFYGEQFTVQHYPTIIIVKSSPYLFPLSKCWISTGLILSASEFKTPNFLFVYFILGPSLPTALVLVWSFASTLCTSQLYPGPPPHPRGKGGGQRGKCPRFLLLHRPHSAWRVPGFCILDENGGYYSCAR